MKTLLLTLALCACAGATAIAQSDQIILKRAKEQRDQNNVRQGVAPPTQQPAPASASSTTPASTAPAPSQSMINFRTDLATIKANDSVTTDTKQRLTRELLAMAQTGSKPAPASANKVVEGLANSQTVKPLSSSNLGRVVQELDAVLNPGKYPAAKLDAIYDDIQAVLVNNGMSRNDAVKVVADIKTVSTEVRSTATK